MLTEMGKKFADALAAGKSATDAAIEAGYSARCATSIGLRLARDPEVIAHIARRWQAAPRYKRIETPVVPRQNVVYMDQFR